MPRRLVKDGTKAPAARLPMVRMPMRKVRRNPGPSLAVRKLVVARDGFSCVCCGTSIIGRRYSLLRRASQGPNTPENLITVLGWGTEDCCGRIYLFRVRADKAKGYRLAAGEDPANKPMVIVTEDGGALVWLTASGTYSTGPPPPRQQAATLRLLRAAATREWRWRGIAGSAGQPRGRRRAPPFKQGTTMQLSHLFQDLATWYEQSFPQYAQRVQAMLQPGLSPAPGTLTLQPAGQSEADVAHGVQRYHAYGHTGSMSQVDSTTSPTTSNYGVAYPSGTTMPVRGDFDTLDNPFITHLIRRRTTTARSQRPGCTSLCSSRRLQCSISFGSRWTATIPT